MKGDARVQIGCKVRHGGIDTAFPLRRQREGDTGFPYPVGMSLGERVRRLRKEKRWTQEQLAEAVSRLGQDVHLSQTQVAAIEKGVVTRPRCLIEIATVLGTSHDWLLEREPGAASSANHNVEIGRLELLRRDDAAPPPLVVYRTSPATRGRAGGFMLFAERVGEVERPEFLRFSVKAFAAKVIDDLNTPVYRRRDLVLVDPDSPPVVDEDSLFCGDPATPAGTHAILGCLVSYTADLWTIHQYGVKGERTLPRAEYPHAWPIVGRYNRR